MDDMDLGSASASGSENHDLSEEEDEALSPAPISDLVTVLLSLISQTFNSIKKICHFCNLA
jgi:hypothetical protein